jgi:chemotaxis protein methyltransferase CheR
MTLLSSLPRGWAGEVLATDLSTRVLERAREAVWPAERERDVPAALRRTFLVRRTGAEGATLEAGPELRAAVRFARVNLVGDAWPAGTFDAIFCRNVLIYFDRETRLRVVERLVERVAPGGWLVLGHAESLGGGVPGVRAVAPNVYAALRPA